MSKIKEDNEYSWNDTNTTEEGRKTTMAFLNSIPTVSVDKLIFEYQKEMDQFIEEFNASSYYELLCRADEGNEFPPEISCKILDKYSFIVRHKSDIAFSCVKI